MGETLVWNARLGVSGMPKSEYLKQHGGGQNRSDVAAPMLIRDIDSYYSVATGEHVTSRSQHREMLKANGLVELGNDMPSAAPRPSLPSPHEDVKRAIEDVQAGRGTRVTECSDPTEFED